MRCCQCGAFQSQQVKQVQKFSCALCNTKQTVQKVYAISSSGADIRKHVQALNLQRGSADAAAEEFALEQRVAGVADASNRQALPQGGQPRTNPADARRWAEYVEEEDQDHGNEHDHAAAEPVTGIAYATAMPAAAPKQKQKRGQGCSRGGQGEDDDDGTQEGYRGAGSKRAKGSWGMAPSWPQGSKLLGGGTGVGTGHQAAGAGMHPPASRTASSVGCSMTISGRSMQRPAPAAMATQACQGQGWGQPAALPGAAHSACAPISQPQWPHAAAGQGPLSQQRGQLGQQPAVRPPFSSSTAPPSGHARACNMPGQPPAHQARAPDSKWSSYVEEDAGWGGDHEDGDGGFVTCL